MHAIPVVRSLQFLPRATGLLALALAAYLAPAVRAQTSSPALIGGATRGGTCEITYLGACPFSEMVCDTNSPAPTGAAGGTAYDPINQLTWHTNGSVILAAVNTPATPCEHYCGGPSPIPNASGLAFDASTGSLWILGLAPEIARTVPSGPSICPQLQSRCSLAAVIPAGTVAAGLALSEKHGLLFYSASSGGNSPVNFVFTAPISDPCRPICRIDLGPAFGIPQADPILGLAFDDATDELYVAAGSSVLRATVSFSSCTATVASPCTVANGTRFHGICLQPQPVLVVGRGCSSAPCPHSCSALRLQANDPTLGNMGFRVWTPVAPANSVALPVLGVGACGPGVSALCGRFHPSPTPFLLTLPPIVLSGPSTCTGSGVVSLPIPAHASLSGATLCIQWVIGCPAGGLGLTEALTIRIGGG